MPKAHLETDYLWAGQTYAAGSDVEVPQELADALNASREAQKAKAKLMEQPAEDEGELMGGAEGDSADKPLSKMNKHELQNKARGLGVAEDRLEGTNEELRAAIEEKLNPSGA